MNSRRARVLVFLSVAAAASSLGCTAVLGVTDVPTPSDAATGGDGGGLVDGTVAKEAGRDAGSTDATQQEADLTSVDGAIHDGGPSGPDATDAQALPRSCLDIHDAGVDADGTYMIDIDGPGSDPAFEVYCYRMATTKPLEYLDLPANVDAGMSNFSGLITICGGSVTMTIFFTRARLLVPSLTIDRTDLTFAQVTSDGGPPNSDPRTLRYASAGSCINGGDTSGRGNADLTGTPFRITAGTTFVAVGYLPACTAVFSPDRKRVDLSGGGYAGWCDVPGADGGVGVLGVEFSP